MNLDCLKLYFPQEIDSAGTSIRQVSRCFTNFKFPAGSIICDFGGGAYDDNIEYMLQKPRYCSVFVVDPYNRSRAYNEKNLEYLSRYPPNFVTCNNVLNVIQEPEAMFNCVRNVACLAQKGVAIFTVYHGNRNGVGSKTTKGYQQNKPTSFYVDFIKRTGLFKKVSAKNGIIVCEN